MNVPKKHHYVPQSLLRNFSISDDKRNVFVYDKQSKRSFPLPIIDAAAERYFYCVTFAGKQVNFEPMFQQLDDRLYSLMREIVEVRSFSRLTPESFSDLLILAAVQLLRTKLQRTTPAEMARQLSQSTREAGIDIDLSLTDDKSRLLSLQRLIELEEVVQQLTTKDIVLFQVASENRLWISDNPVVLFNSFPYGRIGIAAPGIEVYFPISSNLCIGFYCPSIGRQIRESLDAGHPRPHLDNPLYASILHAIDHGTVVDIDENFLNYLNSLQVMQSSKFLYASREAFGLADRILTEAPDLQEVLSLIKVGRMGEGQPPRKKMPRGQFLVIEALENHHVLQITDLTGSGEYWGIEFSTTDGVKLDLIERDVSFDVVTLYHDGQEMQTMRDVVFEHLTREGQAVVRVKYSSESLNQFMAAIGRPI